MKNILIALLIFVLLSACASSRQGKPSLVGLVPLENYFVGVNNGFDTGYNYEVIANQAEFERNIKVAGSVRMPDFNGQTVVAVIHNTGPNQRKEIVMDSAAIGGKQMNVYYHIKETLSSTVTTYLPGLGLATVPKAQGVKQVSFYESGVLVKTVPVTIY